MKFSLTSLISFLFISAQLFAHDQVHIDQDQPGITQGNRLVSQVITENNFMQLPNGVFAPIYMDFLTPKDAGNLWISYFHTINQENKEDIKDGYRLFIKEKYFSLRQYSPKVVNITNNDISDAQFEQIIKFLPDIRNLHLSRCNKLTDELIIKFAENYQNLESVALLNCSALTKDTLFALAYNCKKLESVRVQECNGIKEDSILHLVDHGMGKQLKNVYFLNSHDAIQDTTICYFIKKCGDLINFNFSHSKGIPDDIINDIIDKCPNLETFYFSNCDQLKDSTINKLAEKCKKIKSVNISNCPKLTDSAINALEEYCDQLESINVQGCGNIKAGSLIQLLEKCTKIKEIYFSFHHGFTTDSILPLIQKWQNLEIAEFISCQLDNRFIGAIATYCKNLKILNLITNNAITDVSIRVLVKEYIHLRELNLSGCKGLTDFSFIKVAEKCSFLEAINFSNCNITNKTIYAFSECAQLKRISCSNCSNIRYADIAILIEACPNLNFLDLQCTNTGAAELKKRSPKIYIKS